MGTTAHGLPYPEPTDPVAEGATAIEALATAVDTDLVFAAISYQGTGDTVARPDRLLIQAHAIAWTCDYYGDFTITFPVAFAAGSQVVVVGSDGNPSFRRQYSFRGPNLTNVSVNVVDATGAPVRDANGNLSYVAVGRRA